MDEGDYCYFYTSKYVKRSRNLGITEAGLSYLLKKWKKLEKCCSCGLQSMLKYDNRKPSYFLIIVVCGLGYFSEIHREKNMEERRRKILQELEEKGKVRVNELSAELGCSEVTIRNDIKCMERAGLLIRTHGGALKIEENPQKKYSAESIYRNTDKKRAIAASAYECIEDRDTIIIDDSSTSFYLALHIKQHPEKSIAVVTNSLMSGIELAGLKHVELYMVGGPVGGNLAATIGDEAVEDISRFHVDKAFIGVHGINFDVGITSVATSQMQVKQAILKATEKIYVLADSSKFGGGYLSVICPLKDVYQIITDNQVNKDYVNRAEAEEIPLVLA